MKNGRLSGHVLSHRIELDRPILQSIRQVEIPAVIEISPAQQLFEILTRVLQHPIPSIVTVVTVISIASIGGVRIEIVMGCVVIICAIQAI